MRNSEQISLKAILDFSSCGFAWGCGCSLSVCERLWETRQHVTATGILLAALMPQCSVDKGVWYRLPGSVLPSPVYLSGPVSASLSSSISTSLCTSQSHS